MRVLMAMLAACVLSACATQTPYQPASADRYGFSEQRIETNRIRITFRGNALTDRETVETYLLYRAAEVTIASGQDYFIVADRGTDAQTTLQGSCELVCRYAVPRAWRGDYIVVTVRATRRGDWPTRGTLVRAEETRLVALHRAGDPSARAAAQSLARAQAEFLTDPRSHESDPRRRLLVMANPRERELSAREPRRARPKNLYDAFRQKALGIGVTEPRAPSEESLESALVALERLALDADG